MDDAREIYLREPGPLVVRADVQTGGRGRLGRSWSSPAGGLWCTVALPPPRALVDDPGLAGALGPLVGLAVVEALSGLVELEDLELRWPNDVLAGEKKLSGVLVETTAGGPLLIGVGINANLDPAQLGDGLRTPATTLRELTGREHDLDELAIVVGRHVLGRVGSLGAVGIPSEVLEAIERRLAYRDRTVVVGDRSGSIVGLAPTGALRLCTGAGLVEVVSGELSVRPAG